MSALGQAADDYLRLRRALGHKLDDAGRLLPRFVAYLETIGAPTVTIQAALAWAQQPDAGPGSTVWATRMTIARGFARHLAGIDPRTEVPPAGLLTCRKHRRVPYLYSPADIAAVRAQARQAIPSRLRAATFDTMIGLLAVTGMRIGEVIALDRSDIDWSQGILLVRESKFAKSRQVPIHPSTTTALADYAGQRDRLQPSATTSAFLFSVAGTRLIYSDVSHTFRKLADRAGIASGSAVRPRIHDLRHSFAVHTLLDWYRNGEDVQARLPWLSTYLGHREPRCAPRGASSHPRPSREELEGRFLGLMVDLDPKGEGDGSMPANQRPCPGVGSGALGDPRDMAKAGLPEAQSPARQISTPPETTPGTGAVPCIGM